MAIDYSKFDKMIDVEGLREDIAKAGTFPEIPLGTYEVKVETLELTESKKGDPMVKIQFRILRGDYENQCVFINQVVVKPTQIDFVMRHNILDRMETGVVTEFWNYAQWGKALEEIFVAVKGKKGFLLEVGENKGYKTYKIQEKDGVFNL